MEFDFLDTKNDTKEIEDKKKADFIKRLKVALKKTENKEKKNVETAKRKRARSSKVNKSKS